MSKVTIKSGDDVRFEVELKVAEQSTVFRNVIGDTPDDASEIPVPNVQSTILKKVLEWCEYHKDDPPASGTDEASSRVKASEISAWDQKFLNVDQEMLFEIILAANYLDIRPLLEVGCATVANMIKNKTPEEIRKHFNITNDFTPEEEQQIRREHEWAQDR